MDNIYLIGMMGSGKSTIGEKLANHLNMDYVDIDSDIESIHQMNIVEIFNQLGEKKFRELESVYFLEKSTQPNQVFSTGGGIVLDRNNHDTLKNHGTTFFLEANCEILLDRIKDVSNRPLLNNKNPIKTISSIWEKRKKIYYDLSDHTINTNTLSINSLVSEISQKINK